MTYTTVTFDFAAEDGAPPERRIPGRLLWTPAFRREVDGTVLLPVPFSVDLAVGTGSTEVRPGVWRVKEDTARGKTRGVIVPASAAPVAYADLDEVDLDTLEPLAQPEAAWWTALRNSQREAVDPEVLRGMVDEAVDAALTEHVQSETPHPAYDDMPDPVLIFENNLI